MVVGDVDVLYENRDGSTWIHRGRTRENLEPALPDTSVAAGFSAAVMDRRENPAPASECGYARALTEAAYRSAAEKRIVTIEIAPHHRSA